MELRDIEYFAVVAKHGHLGRAAEALGLSTPALSKSLRRLEKSAQAKLVRRTPKGVELTAEGNVLFSRVHGLRLSLDDVAREISDLSQGRAGHLRIGVHPGIFGDLLAHACSAFLKDAPNVMLTVTVVTTDLEWPPLRSGELDLVVSGNPTPPYEDLIQEHLFDDEVVVFASADHRLTKQKRVTIADVAQERWALTGVIVQGWRQLQRAFEDNGLPYPRIAVKTSYISLRDHLVASSDLLGLTSRRFLRQAATRLKLIEIPVRELMWTHRAGVSYRKGAYLSPAARRFIEILKSTARDIAKEP